MANNKNKSDYKNKTRTDLNKLIPAYVKDDTLETLNNNLFNRYLTKDETRHVVDLIGDEDLS